jgi:ribosomal peptide maturation radical SAM protein 1
MSEGRRVLLITAPWLAPSVSGLAVATLRPLLEGAGLPCDDLHASLLFPTTPTPRSVMETYSGYLFVPYAYPRTDRVALVTHAQRRYLHDMSIGGIRAAGGERLGLPPEALGALLLADIERAGVCLDRVIDRALDPAYDVIGLSATFESQLPAALAIARRLRAARPDLKIALGGATCFEEQGDGLAASFPEFDAICHTEGEPVIVPLVRALRGEIPYAAVPGIAWREDGVPRRTPAPPLLRDLDALPIPDYRGYLAQLQESEWRDEPEVKLLFEASRGCWWGEKHLCTFCGLNPEGLPYRAKSPARAYEEIRALHERHERATFLQSTDNILPMRYIAEVMPRLAPLAAAPHRPLRMFFMIKANLRRDQLQVLREGGVVAVQPGVESFHDRILANMDKGVTAAGQVQLLKWAHEADLDLTYNIIIRNPGDEPAFYDEMADLIPFLVHLPPPTGVTPMMLNRFSLYQRHPARYGITDPRPRPHYQVLYPDPAVDLQRVAYEFEYEHPILHDEALAAAQRRFVERFEWWRAAHRPGSAYWIDRGAVVLIRDDRGAAAGDRPAAPAAPIVLAGPAAAVFRYLDQARAPAAIERRFPELDPSLLRALLDTWLRRRWICSVSGKLLGVLPARGKRQQQERGPREQVRLPVVAVAAG